MAIGFPVKEYDRLTQAYIDLYICTYLLQMLEEFTNGVENDDLEPMVVACARVFLYDAQQRELRIMHSVLDQATPFPASANF